MILEIAIINIKNGSNSEFEAALEKAQAVISRAGGYLGHQFHQCLEETNRYTLLIRWQNLEAHTIGFRESDLFKEWRGLIGPYFEVPPNVQHYELKMASDN